MQKRFNLLDNRIVETSDPLAPILVFINPDAEELRYLQDDLKIDPHNISSALDPDELARVELEPDHLALILKRPKNYSSEDNFLFKIMSLGVFLFREKLVIVKADEVPLFDGKLFMGVKSVIDVLLRTIYSIVSHFLSHLKVINMISDSLEQKISQSMGSKYLLNMFTLEKSLVYYLNATNSNSAVIEKIKNNCAKIGFTTDSVEYLDDLIIESNQCVKQAEIYSNVLAGLMDARASIVNNNLNLLMKQLTVISVVFMPLNVIAGIGGMSEFSMMTNKIPWQFSYSVFSIGLIIVALLTYFILMRFGLESKTSKNIGQ